MNDLYKNPPYSGSSGLVKQAAGALALTGRLLRPGAADLFRILGRSAAVSDHSVAPYAKLLFRNWWSPGYSLIRSNNKALRVLGRAYKHGLSNVQKLGPLAMASMDEETLDKIPEPLRALPAYSQLLSPKGLATGLAYNALGRFFGRNPDTGVAAGKSSGKAVSNIVNNVFVNKKVPLVPRLFKWSPSAVKNFNTGFADEVTHSDKIESAVQEAARKVYESADRKLPGAAGGAVHDKLPLEEIQKRIHGFFNLPLDRQIELVRDMPSAVMNNPNVKTTLAISSLLSTLTKARASRATRKQQ